VLTGGPMGTTNGEREVEDDGNGRGNGKQCKRGHPVGAGK